ncbi:MAG: hypothetical protein L3J92_00915 [Thermoplasmata archaeon]|jgi:hypothetical protein|nr:hypothetical protein [Thermoplasmata archaeon]
MPPNRVLEWLLEETEPAARYLALRELLDRPANDPEVERAQKRIPTMGWAGGLLVGRDPAGWWVSPESLYRPKYLSTNWRMLALSDLGLTREVPAIRTSCELWMKEFAAKDGGLGGNSVGTPHHCAAGNQARALIRMGYAEDPRVRRTLEWLVETAHPKGGWSCFSSGRNLDSWEGLSAFAAYPRHLWTEEMTRVVGAASEFFLERELHRQGARYAPWFRFHYPVHYYYDLLVGLDLLTALGYSADPRLAFALSVLRKRRRADGRWNLDAEHPDVEGAMSTWFRAHPNQRPTPLTLEKLGRPSKMVTLRALTVLKRLDTAGR